MISGVITHQDIVVGVEVYPHAFGKRGTRDFLPACRFGLDPLGCHYSVWLGDPGQCHFCVSRSY